MAQLPNLINASVINGKSNYIKQTTEVVEILSNPKGSGKVLKVNSLSIKFTAQRSGQIYIVNDQHPNLTFMYDEFRSGDIINRWKVINRNEMFYLQEGDTMYFRGNVGSSGYNDAFITIGYEEIS
jgi:hypothetical protein